MAITPEEFKLVEKRMEAWNEKIGRATLREGIILTKEQMLEHIKAEDKLGKELTEVQMHYLRQLKRR